MPYYLTTAERKDVKSCTEPKPFAAVNVAGMIVSLHRRPDLAPTGYQVVATLQVFPKEVREIRRARDRGKYVRLVVKHNGKSTTKQVRRIDFNGGAPVARIVEGEHRYSINSDAWHPYLDIRFYPCEIEARQSKAHAWMASDGARPFYRNLADTIVPATIKEI